MARQNPLVSVVIVNWNGLDDTKECLKYLKIQTYKNYEVIVVDNGSVDGSLEFLRKLKGIMLVENPKNLGFTGGHIAGYKVSKGEFILLLNNDAIMDKSYLAIAVRNMLEDRSIGAVGGRAYHWDDSNPLFDTTNKFYSYQNINPITAEGIFAQEDEGAPQEVNNVSGSCVMIRRTVVDQIGYLHNPFFAYFEESDLFARMKRAGHKIIYHPELAIWHANAKTSTKKAPTFSLYMMMRNRFRFAVRNFDSWSLRRFLKFYLKMGIASIIKSFLPLKQRPMHQAYAKAFLYNLVFGLPAFGERYRLRRSLGRSDYNQIIVREQTGISVISDCRSKARLESLIELSRTMSPIDEILAVTDNESLIKYLKSIKDRPITLRLCVNRGYFQTHSLNLGAVCAKNDWLLLNGSANYRELLEEFKVYSEKIYYIKRSSKKLACLTSKMARRLKFESTLKQQFSQEILIKRDLFIDEGGLDKSLSIENAKRQIIAYSSLSKKLFPIVSDKTKTSLLKYSGEFGSHELHKKLVSKLHQAENENKKPSLVDKLANRYYRFAQTRNLVVWLFYWRIPWRLKMGRLKNTLLAAVTLKPYRLARELKHMRNEVVLYKNAVDMVELKKNEQARLKYLTEHPSETITFIILRDRYQPLKKLMDWLESQNIKKVVFIDNDSKLPPLVDYLEQTNHQVLELKRNMAQQAPWSAGIIKVLLPDDFYIVTDPDIIPVRSDRDVIKRLYEVHQKFPYHLKVGLGLKIDDLPDHYPLKEAVQQWESQFWKHELEPDIYEATVDTTFALYKPYSYKYALNPSIRIGEPYVARHLPWYNDSKNLSDEDIFYRLRADHNVNSWDRDHLPDRYKKELSKG